MAEEADSRGSFHRRSEWRNKETEGEMGEKEKRGRKAVERKWGKGSGK